MSKSVVIVVLCYAVSVFILSSPAVMRRRARIKKAQKTYSNTLLRHHFTGVA
jgi:hypothetical protein